MPVDANYSALTQEINWNLKAFKLKVGYRVRITNYNNVFSIGFTKNWLKEILFIDSVLKTNPWIYRN